MRRQWPTMSLAARAAAALLLSTSAVSCRNAGEPPGQAASGKVKVQPMLKLERTETCWLLTNSLSAEQVKLSAQAPTFDFGSFKLGGATAGDGQWQDSVIDGRAAQVGRWVVAGERPAEIRAVLQLDPKRALLRKTVELKLADAPPEILRLVVIDEVDDADQPLTHRGGYQSYPVLGRSFFFGVEFPVATTKFEGDRVTLSHCPACTLKAGKTFRSHPAVYGACTAGRALEAFKDYIAGLRPTPKGVHFNYNSWWTSPVPYTEEDILKIIRAFRENMHAPYGVSPDSFCIDMGWAKNTTVWGIDPELFPQGFENIRKATNEIGSTPGLWISPSGVYGQALDLKWAAAAGYEADRKACLAGPRYQSAFKRSLLDMVGRYGIRHVKFDGYVPTCNAADHGHAPGQLSAEPMARGLIDVFESLRKIAPDLWMEPTCFGFDPGPWWLMYCNSVIGTFGDDAPFGRVPCPVYRESYTTGRDYYNLKGARDILAPIAAQEVLGIIHQTKEPLQNDAVVTVLRGHQFVSLYVNPKCMTPRRWEFLAALMLWARRNADVLENTRAIPFASWRESEGGPAIHEETLAPREPYGYAHWNAGRSLVCLRNPWIEPARLELSPASDAGVPASASGLSATAIYPERRTIATGLDASKPLVVSLAPYETVVIELAKEANRFKTADPTTIDPPTVKVKASASRFRCSKQVPRYGRDFTRMLAGEGPYFRLHLDGEVVVQEAENVCNELMLLIEGESNVQEPFCALNVNGAPAQFRIINSSAGWRATGRKPPENWTWLVAPLAPGSNRIEGSVTLSGDSESIAGWIAQRQQIEWKPLARVDGSLLPQPEERWLNAVRLFDPTQPTDELPAEEGEPPISRIEGVYLDTLEPVSVSQGWGKLRRNQSVWEKPMTIAGRRFYRGLGTHSPSRIVYDLGGKYRRFTAWAGADQATGPTITMEVHIDGRTAWKSGSLTRHDDAKRINLDVTGARRLELLVGDDGNGISADHADWAEAILVE